MRLQWTFPDAQCLQLAEATDDSVEKTEYNLQF